VAELILYAIPAFVWKLVVVAIYAGLYELTPLRMPADVSKTWRERCGYLFRGPGWSPDGTGGGARD
jgi:hypothetical protein